MKNNYIYPESPLYDPVGTEVSVGSKVIYNLGGVLAPGIVRESVNRVQIINGVHYFSGIISVELTENVTVRSVMFFSGHISKIKSPDSIFVLR